MSYHKRGAGGKRDLAEPAIVDALRVLGCRVYCLSGQGNPDLLVRSCGGRWVPLEVKSKGGTLTKNQQDLPWAVVRTPEQAIAAVFSPAVKPVPDQRYQIASESVVGSGPKVNPR